MSDLLHELSAALTGRYAVEAEAGRGGMATVFRAEDLKHGRPVAVKVLRPELAYTIDTERFLREIAIAARLTHPHILPVYDSGEASGLIYYVMPFIPGESLRSRLDRVKRLEVDEAVEIAREVASALAYAHGHHVVHRDITPANILLSGGHAVVMDFGIARAFGEGRPRVITGPGMAVGTPTYMSPEQASGEDVDGRADVYSLGCVLYEMLVGEPPYDAPTTHAILQKCFSQPIPSARAARRAVPRHVDRAITTALAKVASERFPTAAAFAAALSGPTVPSLPPRPRSIAVLPFVNLSPDVENDYFSDGITEEIIGALVKLPGLRVAARTSCFAFKGKAVSLPEAGAALGVETLLEGSVRRADNRLRVTARLSSVAKGIELWSERYDREVADVFVIQDEIAAAIASTLADRLGVQPHERVIKRYTESPEAYELYLRGRYAGKTRRRTGLLKGIEYFEQAIAVDRNYSLAYAGLSDSYSLLAWYRFLAPHDAFPKAKIAALQALDADDLLPEAHTSHAVVKLYYDWDWSGAERSFARALELNAADPVALQLSAEYFASQGGLDEARTRTWEAHKHEPLSLVINAGVGWMAYLSRDYGRAIEEFRSTLELDPEFVFLHWFAGQAYAASGRFPEAMEAFRQGWVLSDRHPVIAAYLGYACARAGREAEARALLSELREQARTQYVPSDCLAVLHLGLGETDESLAWLERACEERAPYLVFLNADPMFDELREHRRFASVLGRVGLGQL